MEAPAAASAAASAAAAGAALAQVPEHDKALRNVLHAGGFNKGAKVWVPVREGIGWVRARVVAKEEGAGGLTTFTVEEEGGGGVSALVPGWMMKMGHGVYVARRTTD